MTSRDVAAALRFGLAGLLNTAVTAAALSGLSLLIDSRIAYTIVFGLGIVMATWLAGRFVFRTRLTGPTVVAYVVMYLVVYAIGLMCLVAIDHAGWSSVWSGAVVLVTAPLSFLGGRLIFWGRSGGDRPATPTAPTKEHHR